MVLHEQAPVHRALVEVHVRVPAFRLAGRIRHLVAVPLAFLGLRLGVLDPSSSVVGLQDRVRHAAPTVLMRLNQQTPRYAASIPESSEMNSVVALSYSRHRPSAVFPL